MRIHWGLMRTMLLGLHGFTMNGASLRGMLGTLEPQLAEHVDLRFPDAPHAASEASVANLLRRMGGSPSPPPNLEWWNSSDDGRQYQGWAETRAQLSAELQQRPAVGLLGFSQGAAVAAALSAVAQRGSLPSLGFVVLVGGFPPRAAELLPFFEEPLTTPSLHVWGEADPLAKHAALLVTRFSAPSRQVVTWPGPHSIPTRGEAADAIVEFVRRHARNEPISSAESTG
jgi:pimeloyl-ACP methyl ester carboxylesterase